MMELGELIAVLEREPANKVVREGFEKPHSYRGYYDQLAFRPKANAVVGDMLEAAKSAVNATYTGYKGGEYTMTTYTDCWLANYGSTGDELSERLLRYMLADEVRP